jgi:hypothetical protein
MWERIKSSARSAWSHRTKIAGMIGIGAGFAQNHLADIGYLIPPHWHGILVASLGMVVFCIGLYNSMNR